MRLPPRRTVLGCLVGALIVGCGGNSQDSPGSARSGIAQASKIEAPTPTKPPTLVALANARPTLDDAAGWINSDGPVHLDRLRGKIVLLDFWTYCCINCHHILPDLARLEAKYRNELVVVGVHSAKFEAEKDLVNVRSKVREYGIRHPVANDPEMRIWNRFGARSWPSLALIDVDGRMIDLTPGASTGNGMLMGEGHFAELDAAIGQLVDRARRAKSLDETPFEPYTEADRPIPGGLLYPGKITVDPAGQRLIVSDTGHNRIVVTDLDGRFVQAIGDGQAALQDGDLASSRFQRPQGTCLVGDTLYVADTENHALRAVDLKAGTVATVAGTGVQSQAFEGGGPGRTTPINSPWDVLLLPGTRTLAVAMAGPHQIWRFDLDSGEVRHWAGSGFENIRDGGLLDARFAQPSGLATDDAHLFVADSEVSGLRSINLGPTPQVKTIVGLGLFQFGDTDGAGPQVRLQHCLGLAFGAGKLYVADTYNNKVKVCDPAAKTVTTLVGSHERGVSDDPPQFNEPGGLAILGNSLYVADTNNHAIRVVDLASKRVRTLDLTSVPPPTHSRTPRFTNAQVIEMPAATVRPAALLDFEVTLPIPAGAKLGADAPLVTLIETNPNEALPPAIRGVAREVEKPNPTFRLAVPLAQPLTIGSTLAVKISVSAFVCLPNSLCTLKSFVWTVPINCRDENIAVLGPIRLAVPGR